MPRYIDRERKEERMIHKKREWHELEYTEKGKIWNSPQDFFMS